MKLLIVYDNLDIGGIQTKIIDLVNFLNTNQPEIEVVVCLLYKSGQFSYKIKKNNLILVPTIAQKKFLGRHWFQKFQLTPLILWLTYQIAVRRPNYILSFISRPSILTIIAKKLAFWHRCRIVVGEDSVTSKNILNEPIPILRQPLIKKTYPLVNKIIVQTLTQKQDLIDNFNIRSEKISISPNWLPLEFKFQDKTTLKRNIDILYIGRLDPQKNLGLFLDIISQIVKTKPNLVVKIIGQGSDQKFLKQKTARLNLTHQVTFLPSTKNPKKFYHRAKIFLLSSHYEGFPLTVLEAIACNCFPILPNLSEITPFFSSHPDAFIYSTTQAAVRIILHRLRQKTPSPLLKQYRQTIFQNQNVLITKYLDEIIQ